MNFCFSMKSSLSAGSTGRKFSSRTSEISCALAWAMVLRCQESHCLSSFSAMNKLGSLRTPRRKSLRGSLGLITVGTTETGALDATGFGSPALAEIYSALVLKSSNSWTVTLSQSLWILFPSPSLLRDRACNAKTLPARPLEIFSFCFPSK